MVGIGVRLPFASWENYCVWEFLALRQPNSAWLGLGVALANMLPSTAQGGMRSESAEVPLNAGAKPNAKAYGQGKANPNSHHPNGPTSFGFGKGIGSRPTLHNH